MRWACFIILLWQVDSLSSAQAGVDLCTDRVDTSLEFHSIIIVVVVVVVVEVLKNQVSCRTFSSFLMSGVRSLQVVSFLTPLLLSRPQGKL